MLQKPAKVTLADWNQSADGVREVKMDYLAAEVETKSKLKQQQISASRITKDHC